MNVFILVHVYPEHYKHWCFGGGVGLQYVRIKCTLKGGLRNETVVTLVMFQQVNGKSELIL